MWGRLIFLAAGIGIGILSKTEVGKDILDTLKEGSGQIIDEIKEEVEEVVDTIKNDLKKD
jgi:hypothetical protein